MNKEIIENSIKDKINKLKLKFTSYEVGTIISIMDDVITLEGLYHIAYGSLLFIGKNKENIAQVLKLETDKVIAVIIQQITPIYEGDTAYSDQSYLTVPVGPNLLGRIIDPLGNPLDKLGLIQTAHHFLVERPSAPVMARSKVNQPLFTGIKMIDYLIPIGLGQRELIVGNRNVGKTQIAIDTIINQKGKNIKCIYVAIGQRASKVNAIINTLEKHGALEYTIVIFTSSSDKAMLQFIAPYAGSSIGEYFMEQGEDAIVVYDDLTKHAWCYRQISLLLANTPGREAYPGDLFYSHSRLLERSACVNKEYVQSKKITEGEAKIGSLTALPIVEIQNDDMTSFVATNIISITDGQIILSSELFKKGIRPAIDPGNSVSRVGQSAQTRLIRSLVGNLRLFLAQYRELSSFSELSSELDPNTTYNLKRGATCTSLLVQEEESPLNYPSIVLTLILILHKDMTEISPDHLSEYELFFHKYFKENCYELYKQIITLDTLDQEKINFIIHQAEQARNLFLPNK
jgi:F-type H+-transporting ATPase subunit alpha